MSVDPNAGTGSGPGLYIQAGNYLARLGNRILGTGESKRERAQYEAAQREGYSTRPGRFPVTIDPQGNVTTPEKAREVGRVAIVESGRTSKEQAEADKEYRRARREEISETRQREREARKERERKRTASSPDAKRPQGRVGRIIDAATAVLVGSGVADIIRNPPLPDIPPPPPPDPGMGSPGEFDLPPKSAPWTPPPVVIPPVQAPPPAPKAPAPVDTSNWEPILSPVPVYSSPIPTSSPTPAPPAPATAMPGGAPVASAPIPPTAPLWKQALPFVLPLALSALTVPSGGQRRRRDPLTVSQTPTLGSLQPTLASYPLPFPGSGFGGSGASTSGTCECKPKGPRKRRRNRTVCYSGTYTEKASGIRKVKKRKVPCR